jgi:translation initiation factor 2 subunit 3
VQDLTKLKVETLTPLSPEVISRQATINIGKRPLIAWAKAVGVDGNKTL